MTDYSAKTLTVPGATGTGAILRDPILAGLPAGAARFVFDVDFSWCYRGQDDPTGGDTIKDLAERADGDYTMNTVFEAPAATFVSGGFDFTDLTHSPFGVRAPADAWDSIFAGDQHFLWFGYYKLPTAGEWKPSNGYSPFFDTAEGTGSYITEDQGLIVTGITPYSTNLLRFARQTAIGSIDELDLIPTADHFGKMCQLAFWRTADGSGARCKSADGEVSGVAAVGSDNTADPSGVGPVWGNSARPNVSLSTENRAATNFRVYRGGLIDMASVTADPVEMMDADWSRVQARKTASGDTIFV
ncbi:hypothetical protein [Mameliella sp.]|uniref:hypothetical protein n=1 Tax=Mameliella sp. TaxID=1924940 RepID=UPI003B500E99